MGNQPRLHGERSCLETHWQGQPFLQHWAQSINTLFALLRLRHFSPLKSNPSPQSHNSTELMWRSDSSLKAASMISRPPPPPQMWVILVTLPKKRTTSTTLNRSSWLQQHIGCSSAQLTCHLFSNHKHNKTKSKQQTAKGPHGFKTYPTLTSPAPTVATRVGWELLGCCLL